MAVGLGADMTMLTLQSSTLFLTSSWMIGNMVNVNIWVLNFMNIYKNYWRNEYFYKIWIE